MRIFDTNELFYKFGNTLNGSTGTFQFAFDENLKTKWQTSGEDSDSDPVYIENIPESNISINRILIIGTNITDLAVQVNLGAGDVALSYTKLIKSNDNTCWLFEFDEISTSKVKITGQTTIVANSEKEIAEIYAFKEIGELKNYADIIPTRVRTQIINKLQAGKVHVINQGRHFQFQLGLKTHYNANDNTIINSILQRDMPMFLWLNNNNEDVMVMNQEPFRFQDIYKVAVIKNDSLKFTKNLFFSGIDNQINFEEVY